MLEPLSRLVTGRVRPVMSYASWRNILLCRVVCQRSQRRQVTTSPEVIREKQEKVLRVAIVGVPNAGKSTLINTLVNRHICAASKKVHTTKTMAKAVYLEDNTQIVFVDTPGIVTVGEQKKFNLNQEMLVAPRRSVKDVDIIGVIHDVAHTWSRDYLHPLLIHLLKNNSQVPSFLILNKIDIMRSKRKLLNSIRILCNGTIAGKPIKMLTDIKTKVENIEKGYSGFSDVFIVSALSGDGVEKIRSYLVHNAKPGKWTFSENEFTDQSKEKLIEEAVRAKLLDFLPQEMPYKLNTEIEFLKEKEDGKIVIIVSVTAPSERIEKFVAGAGGGKLKIITDSIRNDLYHMFKRPISITLSLRTETKMSEED